MRKHLLSPFVSFWSVSITPIDASKHREWRKKEEKIQRLRQCSVCVYKGLQFPFFIASTNVPPPTVILSILAMVSDHFNSENIHDNSLEVVLYMPMFTSLCVDCFRHERLL